MATLEPSDRTALLKVLLGMPILQDARGRRQALELAGLSSLAPQVDLDGPAFIAMGELLQVLTAYGRDGTGREAIGLFLTAIREFSGSGSEVAGFFNALIDKYGLTRPVKLSATQMAPRQPLTAEAVQEKIIGENTLRHIWFLTRAIELSRTVALVDVGDWVGTGFLVGRDLLITNQHNVPSADYLPRVTFRFNYQMADDKTEAPSELYRPAPGGLIASSEALDYAIVQLAGNPGDKWGVAKLSARQAKVGERINVIQHPGGLPKQISFQNNFVEYSDTRILQYITSTAPGSSGAPVFDDNWEVVGIHHAGGDLIEPSTKRQVLRNEGIACPAILADLPPDVRQRLGGRQPV